MNLQPPFRPVPRRGERAFTMVEIAICIAIVGFALVAIIGVLPSGVTVQKQNREDTIINEDGSLWLEAIRGGAVGLDYLTNNVDWIQIKTQSPSYLGTNLFDYKQGYRNGRDIIGLLSLPKYLPDLGSHRDQWLTNTVQAFVHAVSGPAVDKTPHNDFGFFYRMTTELVPFNPAEGIMTNVSGASPVTQVDLFKRAANLGQNLYNLRLTFDWPVYQTKNGPRVGNNRKVFSTLVSGSLTTTSVSYLQGTTLYFLQPSQFVFVQ